MSTASAKFCLPNPITHDLLKSDTIKHGFFTRKGGVSPPPYDSLNLGHGSDDTKDNIKKNRELVAQSLGFNEEQLVNLYQIHSNLVIPVSAPYDLDNRPKADAMITKTKGLLLGVLTADCAPILFMDEDSMIVGAAHAGWRGAVSGIIENTVAAMIDHGANLNSIKAVIGPCIGWSSYEVSKEFKTPIVAKDEGFQRFFKESSALDKLFFDLPGFCTEILSRSGLTQIATTNHDTCELEDQFFSYRRGSLKGEPDYGRLISVIGLKQP
jgi:polyphenol oxidase